MKKRLSLFLQGESRFFYSSASKGGLFMQRKPFPVIDSAATGENIVRLRMQCGLTVRDVQHYFGFDNPQAIYKWLRGKSL